MREYYLCRVYGTIHCLEPDDTLPGDIRVPDTLLLIMRRRTYEQTVL